MQGWEAGGGGKLDFWTSENDHQAHRAMEREAGGGGASGRDLGLDLVHHSGSLCPSGVTSTRFQALKTLGRSGHSASITTPLGHITISPPQDHPDGRSTVLHTSPPVQPTAIF